jgi:hypothetical protein
VGSTPFAQPLFAQTKATPPPAGKTQPPPPPSATPPLPAKFVRPIKGTATVEFIQGPSKKIGNDIVTVMKVKNTSAGAISLFKIDEYWYDKKLNVVTGDTQPYRKPFNPGEIIEITLRSPWKASMELYKSQYQFSHANGDIKPKAVKKLE